MKPSQIVTLLKKIERKLDTSKFHVGKDPKNPNEGAFWTATSTVGEKMFVNQIFSEIDYKNKTVKAEVRYRLTSEVFNKMADVSLYIDYMNNEPTEEEILKSIKENAKYAESRLLS